MQRFLRIHSDEQGFALVLALAVLLVLTIALAATVQLSASSARHSYLSNADQKAFALAEAGVNAGSAVLQASDDPTVWSEYPVSDSDRPIPGGDSNDYWSRSGPTSCGTDCYVWTITGHASVENPTGPAAAEVTRITSAQFRVEVTIGSEVLDGSFMYSSGDFNVSGGSNLLQESIITDGNFAQSGGNSQVQASATVVSVKGTMSPGAWMGMGPSTPPKLIASMTTSDTIAKVSSVSGYSNTVIGGGVTIAGMIAIDGEFMTYVGAWSDAAHCGFPFQVGTGCFTGLARGFLASHPAANHVGCYPTSSCAAADVDGRIAKVATQGGCIGANCANIHAIDYQSGAGAELVDTTDLQPTFVVADARNGAAPGPAHLPSSCPFSFATTTDPYWNGATVNLTPASSYTCSATGGGYGDGNGQISWNNTTKELKVRGTVYLPSNATVTQNAYYTSHDSGDPYADATLYVAGTFTYSNINLCGLRTTTTLTGDITSSQIGAIFVGDTRGFPTSGTVSIDGENIDYTALQADAASSLTAPLVNTTLTSAVAAPTQLNGPVPAPTTLTSAIPDATTLNGAILPGTTITADVGATTLNGAVTNTTLNGAITTTGQTSITVASGVGIANNAILQIDDEKVKVTAGGGTTNLTVQRAQNGTTAATHADGAQVGKTVIAVSSTTNFANGDVVKVDSEQMLLTANPGGGNLTVTRGYNGTTTASHASGAEVNERMIAVSSASGLAVNDVLFIDSEQMQITNISGTTLTVVRGVNSTTPAGHANGAGVNNAIRVVSGTGIANNDVILIGSEQMLVTAGGGTTTLTVTRGYNSTSAVAHADGAQVILRTVHVASGASIRTNDILRIDSEQVQVTAGAGSTTLTVTRAVNGTALASHANGAQVVDKTVIVDSGAGIPDGDVIQVDSELMTVVSGGGTTTMIVTRGANGTTIAAHANNTPVYQANIKVASGSAIANGDPLQIELEHVLVMSGGGTTTLIVTRGVDGTSAVAHASGSQVGGATIHVASANFADLHTVLIGLEHMQVIAGGGTTTLLVSRGFNSTASASHANGSQVYGTSFTGVSRGAPPASHTAGASVQAPFCDTLHWNPNTQHELAVISPNLPAGGIRAAQTGIAATGPSHTITGGGSAQFQGFFFTDGLFTRSGGTGFISGTVVAGTINTSGGASAAPAPGIFGIPVGFGETTYTITYVEGSSTG